MIGWFQGRLEWGPRALGNRSILIDPRLPDARARIDRIKNREPYRPYGASVLAERFGAQQPITALYRPAKQAWLAEMMKNARNRPGMLTSPATLSGVRQMLRALKSGQTVGLLPDQVPPEGMGQWTPFFGKPAYTMTLAARLALQTGAQVVLIWGERLPWGRGYRLHTEPLGHPLSDDLDVAVVQINQAMERLVLARPDQYLWGYARYKAPRPQ